MLNSTMVDNIIKRLKKKQLSKLIGPFNITRARLSNSIGGNEAMKNLVPKVAFSYMQPPTPQVSGIYLEILRYIKFMIFLLLNVLA